MKKVYDYVVNGSAAHGQTWITEGTIECAFDAIWASAMQESFDKLTHGQAVFGRPGVGCKGPYDVTQVLIKQVRQ